MNIKKALKSFIYLFTKKHINEANLNIKKISLSAKELSYFNLSSNRIISFAYQGRLYYFRECPRVLGRKEYFEKSFDMFFESIHQADINPEHFRQEIPIKTKFSEETVCGFRSYLNKKKTDKKFFLTITKADTISQNLNFSIWEDFDYGKDFFAAFGFDDLPENYRDIAIYFIYCMRNACSAYRTLSVVKGEKYSYFLAVRSKSSKIVADFLDIGEMLTAADICEISLDNGETLYGVMSEGTKGERMLDADFEINSSLQRELANLNALDVICFQPDHGPNNYSVYDDSGKLRVCAFDNDNPKTFFPAPFVGTSLSGCSALINGDGFVNRPFFDKALAQRIISLDVKALKKELKPYLNFLQLYATASRIKKLKAAIIRTSESNSSFLIDESAWNDKTLEAELSGKFGRTYLIRAINKNEGQS